MTSFRQFFDKFLSRLNETEFDINCYSGCNNAIMLDLPTVPRRNPTAFAKNCEIAIRHGAEINARRWNTEESCLHILLHAIKPIPGDIFVKSETSWLSYKNYLLRTYKSRLEELLRLGADIYAKDEKHLEWTDGRNIGFTVTRDVYAHEVQDVWWSCIANTKFGYSKEEVIAREAEELGTSKEEYERYLENLSKITFDKRQKLFP